MCWQAVGSVIVSVEVVARYSYPMVRHMTAGQCKITCCYIHYPIIRTDMLSVIVSHTPAHNNAGFIATSPILSSIKLAYMYYRYFARAYGWAGRKADVIMVNSSGPTRMSRRCGT